MKVQPSRCRVRRTRRVGVLLSLVLGLTVIGGAAPSASAQSIDPVEDPGTEIPPEEVPKDAEVVEAEAVLDCTNMAVDVRAYADANKVCDDTRTLSAEEAAMIPADAMPAGSPAPQDIRWGSCGISSIFMWSRGGGYAGVIWGFISFQGNVVRRNLTVRWANWSRETGGYYVDSNWMFDSVYVKARSFYTRSGSVSAWMTGNVRLVWGGTCVILIPTSHAGVT